MPSPLTRNADPTNRGYDPDGAAFHGPVASTWTHSTPGAILGRPAVGSRRLYVGTAAGRVLALGRTNGRVIWERGVPAETVVTPVALADGTVFVGGFDDFGRAATTVHALDAATGEVRWEAGTARGTRNAPVLTAETLLVSHADERLVGYRRTDGTNTQDWAAPGGDLAADGDTLFHANSDGVKAYGLEESAHRWERSLDSYSTVAPVSVDGVVLAGRRSGDLHALDAETGEQRWVTDLFRPEFHDDLRNIGREGQGAPSNRSAISTLSAGGTTVFVGTCNAVFALDIGDGAVRWVRELDCDYVRSSVAAGSRLHLGTADGSVYVLTYDGDIEYQLSPANASTAQATVADGALFVGGEAGPDGPHSEPTSGFVSGYVDG